MWHFVHTRFRGAAGPGPAAPAPTADSLGSGSPFPNARAAARAAFGSELLALLSAPVGSGRGPPAAAVRPVTLGHVKRAGA